MHLISSGAKSSKWHSCIDNPLLVLGMMQKMLQNRKFFNRFLLGIEPSSVVPDRMQCHFIVQPGYGVFMGKQLWTEEEIDLLKRLYPDTPMEEITKTLRRSVDQVRTKVKKLKLRRSKSFIASQRKRYAQFTI